MSWPTPVSAANTGFGRLSEYPLHPFAVIGVHIAKRIGAAQIPRIAKELPIRGAVVYPPSFQVENRDVLANTLGNQPKELPLFAQGGFQFLSLGDVLGGTDAAQRPAALVELDLRSLRNPANRVADHDPQFLVERLSLECRLTALLQGAAIFRMLRSSG